MPLLIRTCKLFDETLAKNSKVSEKLKTFLLAKEQNPLQPFGAKDLQFTATGNFATAVKGLKHAHLSHDISIIYRIHGREPHVLDLYAIFTHDEMGTGQPANIKKQKSAAARFTNQIFK